MPEIRIYSAEGWRDEPPVALTIRIDAVIPEVADIEQAADLYAEQGKALAEALWSALPGGTVDQLLGALLQRKASLFRVPMPKVGPS